MVPRIHSVRAHERALISSSCLCDECAFHSAGSSGDLPDLRGAHEPSTLSLLLDTVVGWRQLELIRHQRAFVRSDAVDPRDRCVCHLRWRVSGSDSALQAVENADVLLNIHEPTCNYSQNEPIL